MDGLEARREEEPVCLRSPQNVGEQIGASHSWPEGLLPTGLSRHRGIMPFNSDKADFPGWGHCRGRCLEL